MNCSLVIFDMDGTILNTLEDLADSLNHALQLSGCPLRTIDEVRSFVGNGIRKLIERSVPANTSPDKQNQIFTDFHAHYSIHCADKTRPYDGIIDLLHFLKEKGIKAAVVSNKADYAVKELCTQYFNGLFDTAVGEQEGIARKPAPDSVNAVLARLQIPRKEAVYIGDSDVDIATAKNARIDCIAVSWGFRSQDFLKEHGASMIVSSTEELKSLIAGRIE